MFSIWKKKTFLWCCALTFILPYADSSKCLGLQKPYNSFLDAVYTRVKLICIWNGHRETFWQGNEAVHMASESFQFITAFILFKLCRLEKPSSVLQMLNHGCSWQIEFYFLKKGLRLCFRLLKYTKSLILFQELVVILHGKAKTSYLSGFLASCSICLSNILYHMVPLRA